MRNQRSIFPGVILVIVGIVLLGQMNNWWNFDWRLLVAFWPVYMILAGLRLVLPVGRRIDWLFAALLLAGMAAVITTPTTTLQRLSGLNRYENRSSQISYDGAATTDKLSLNIGAGATNLHIESLPANDSQLYTAVSRGAELKHSVTRRDRSVTATIDQSGNWLTMTGDIRVAVARSPQLDLAVEAGASTINIDLSDTNASSIKLDGGANDSTIKLGSTNSRQSLVIDGGATNVKVRVPNAAALTITDDSGLASTNFDKLGLVKNDDTYRSSNFDSSALQITILFNGGASSVTIERY